MSLLKIKRLSQSCCFILFVFLLLLPVSAFSEYAVYLDGDSRIYLNSNALLSANSYTAEVSFRPLDFSGLSYVFSVSDSSQVNFFSIVFQSDTISLYVLTDSTLGVSYSVPFVIPFDAYTYLAITNDSVSQSVKIYINGVELPVSFSIISMSPSLLTDTVSKWSITGSGMQGYLDALVISNGIKTASEIAFTAQNGFSCGPDSVGCLLFEEGSGSTIFDSSSSGGSVTSATPFVFEVASAPGGSASDYAFGESGGGSGSGSGVSAAFSPVGDASGLVSGVGAAVIGVGSLLSIMAAYSAVKGIFGG